MRVLCLHGWGTNADVFKAQTAALREAIGGEHEYEFVDGAVPWPAARGIKEIFGDQDYFAYFDPSSPASILTAITDLIEFMEANGPFDGIMGFSQGGSLATTLLVLQNSTAGQKYFPEGFDVPLRCAICFSSGSPIDVPLLEQGQGKELDCHHGDKAVIPVPTANLWARNDIDRPGMGSNLGRYCSAESLTEYVHSAGHGIPSGNSDDLFCVARAIQSTLHKAVLA